MIRPLNCICHLGDGECSDLDRECIEETGEICINFVPVSEEEEDE